MQVRDNILRCNFVFEPLEIWEGVSAKAKKFISQLLVANPNLRPTAREAQQDPWLIEMADLNRNQDDIALNPNVVKALVNFKEYSDMRKLLCEVLSFTLIPDQIQGLRKEFEKMDTDGSGEISMSALKTVLLGNAAQGSLGALTEKEVEDIFNAMRVSKTETTIHWHEFIAAGLSHCKVDERNLRLAFDRLDSDHTGYITFENFMDLIGNGAAHSEEALREMWGEASMSSKDACITYEDFLLLMKGQTKPSMTKVVQPKIRTTTQMIDNMGLHPVMEYSIEAASTETSAASGGFMSCDQEGENSDGPICIDDDGDTGALNMGFTEAMQYNKNGVAIKESLIQPSDPEVPFVESKTGRSKSFDSEDGKAPAGGKNKHRICVNLPEHERTNEKLNNMLNDKSKTPLVVNRELYRAHRIMRLAVLDASKRLDDERQRRARETMRRESMSNKVGAGLIMRHGGELSADAIKQFVVQQQKEEQRQVHEASKRAGRRHARNRTSSDIRGMFGSYGSELANLTTPPVRETFAVAGIPDFSAPTPSGDRLSLPPPMTSQEALTDPNLPDMPVVRNRTVPGQFRKTDYDPFSFGTMKSSGDDDQRIDSSMHKHLINGLHYKKMPSDGITKPLRVCGDH
jgi:Ca2+-binding EF-hand superfamily protein